jgi:methionyl aminopeptidase
MIIAPIKTKSRHDINMMTAAGQIVGEVLQLLSETVKPGMSTLELDDIAEAYIRKNGALPTFKGYYDFPKTVCISVNEEVVHGIPSADKILKDGDIISLDCGATYKGLIADSARTVGVGTITPELEKLLAATKESLYAAIAQMVAGNILDNVSGAVEDVCKKYGYGLVREYGGHSVGHKLHEEPFVSNFRTGKQPQILKPGNTLAIEPMFNLGTEEVFTGPDNWTVITKDHLPSAHFEHTVLVTDGEPQILTEIK